MPGRPCFGPENGMWRGGRTVTPHGYVLVRMSAGHHLADVRGYVYEHRLVAEQKLGRRLRPGEQVHHINGDRVDNRPENLEVSKNRTHHAVLHRAKGCIRRLPGEPNPEVECACSCGESFPRYDLSNRPRRFVSGHNTKGRCNANANRMD